MKFGAEIIIWFWYQTIQCVCESLVLTHARRFLRFDSLPMDKQLIPDRTNTEQVNHFYPSIHLSKVGQLLLDGLHISGSLL